MQTKISLDGLSVVVVLLFAAGVVCFLCILFVFAVVVCLFCANGYVNFSRRTCAGCRGNRDRGVRDCAGAAQTRS